MFNQNISLIGTTGFLTSILSLNAAFIDWETSSVVDDAGVFVNTTGELVAAINSDTAGDNAMISSVNFVGHNVASWNAGIVGLGGVTITSNASRGNFGDTFVQGTGSPSGITDGGPVDNLISSAIWNPQTVILSNLTVGDTYIIQIIGNDSRDDRNIDFVSLLTDGVNGIADSLAMGTAGLNRLSDSAPGVGNPALVGHSIVGTFVADADTQSFNIFGSSNGGTSSNSGGRAQINGFQLRTFAGAGDTDEDGMNDLYEIANGLNINVDDTNLDSDGDGISNIDEFNHVPQLPAGIADADGDGFTDGEEVDGLVNPFGTPVTNQLTTGISLGAATDPLNDDSDDDGVNDFEEVNGTLNTSFANEATDPNSEDTDMDELPDNAEITAMLDPNDATGDQGAAGDPDLDLVLNSEELSEGTNPLLADTDDDGADDRLEIDTDGLLPLDPDTDNDKILDGEELMAGMDGFITDPLAFDTDGDGVPDAYEAMEGVDPSAATGAAVSPNYANITWFAEAIDDYQLPDGSMITGGGTAGMQSVGTLLYAENYQGVDVTVNGIDFTGVISTAPPRCSTNVLTMLSGAASVDTVYAGPVEELNSMLDSVWFNPPTNSIPHVLLTGLTVGETYFVQFGIAEDRGGREGRYAILDGSFGGDDASVPVGSANTIFGGAANPALIFTGRFTATLPTQMFDFQAFDATGNQDEDQIFMSFLQVRNGVPVIDTGEVVIVDSGFDGNGNYLIELANDATGAIVLESPDLEEDFTPITNGVTILGNIIIIDGSVLDTDADGRSFFRVSQ